MLARFFAPQAPRVAAVLWSDCVKCAAAKYEDRANSRSEAGALAHFAHRPAKGHEDGSRQRIAIR